MDCFWFEDVVGGGGRVRAVGHRSECPWSPRRGSCAGIQQLRGQHGGLGTTLQSELRQDAGHVVLHGLLREEHLLPDLPVGQALGDVREQLELLLGELGELWGRARWVADPVQHPRGERGVDERVAGGHLPHRRDQVVALDLLQDVPGGARHDRGEQRLVVVVRRQDQRLDVRVDRADRTAHLDPGPVREASVEDRHVRTHRRDPVRGVHGGSGLAHDLDVPGALQKRAQPLTHDLVVIEQVHADPVVGHATVLHQANATLGGRACRDHINRPVVEPVETTPNPSVVEPVVTTPNRRWSSLW